MPERSPWRYTRALILGVNLAAGRPSLAAAEARALLRGIGSRRVAALELGNEPDVYGVFPWYKGRHRLVFARDAAYGLTAYVRQIARWGAALPRVPLAGPATAKLPWMAGLPALLQADTPAADRDHPPLRAQGLPDRPRVARYPSVANLLSDRSASGLADALAPYVAAAHADGLEFRVDELNSAALAGCLGRRGVSDTFASALWMLDTLFNMASVGVDGVNVHSLPGAAYEPFTFERTRAGWRGFGPPGLLRDDDVRAGVPARGAAAAGARGERPGQGVGDDRGSGDDQQGRPRARGGAHGCPASRSDRVAPRPERRSHRRGHVGRRSAALPTGVLPTPRLEPVSPESGRYWIDLPADSAALLRR